MSILNAQPDTMVKREEDKDVPLGQVNKAEVLNHDKMQKLFQTYELLPMSVNIFLIDGQNIFNNKQWKNHIGESEFFIPLFILMIF